MNIQKLIDDYTSWLRSETAFDKIGEYYEITTPYLDNANDYLMHNCFAGFYHMHADKVLADGKQVGISTGRGEIVHYHTMISHASIDPEYAALGTEVTVLWGSEEYPQKEIRAKVVEFPYLKETLNGDFDVSKVPYGFK